MVNNKKPSSTHRVDILESRPIRLTEDYFDSEDGRKVPMVVKDAWKKLRGEILSLRRDMPSSLGFGDSQVFMFLIQVFSIAD